MPVKAEPKERPIIRMLLSACDNGAWQLAQLDWVEEKQDGAVEVIAPRTDGTRLAVEHTLIQPFVGEKFDSEVFMRAFGRIEKNPDLTLSERHLDVIIPVHAIPKGYNWDEVGQDLLNWLLANHIASPQEGQSSHVVPVAATSKNVPLALPITLRTMHLPGMAGSCLIARDKMPGDLEPSQPSHFARVILALLLRHARVSACVFILAQTIRANAESGWGTTAKASWRMMLFTAIVTAQPCSAWLARSSNRPSTTIHRSLQNRSHAPSSGRAADRYSNDRRARL